MWRSARRLPIGTLTSTFAVLMLAGCAECRLPRIDPSGDHLFISDSPPPVQPRQLPPPATYPSAAVPAPIAAPAPPAISNSIQPVPMPQPAVAVPIVSPYSDVAVTLAPCSRVAPVGAEVILVGGVRGGDNYLRTNRRLDWLLAPGSVGQFTDIGGKNFEDYLVGDFTRPRLVSAASALGSTTRVAERVGQGDSIYIARGESWIALRSPVEGVSRVTVAAPSVVVPADRAKTATIYWYDAQYSFPEAVVTPPGGKGSLTTTVWKLTNRCPRPGWIVRYELIGGPQAVFVPSGTTAVEVPTDAAGKASVEIVQKDPSPGTSRIRVQLFRPANQCSPQFLVRDGCTAVSWTDKMLPSAAPVSPVLPGPASTSPPSTSPPVTIPPPATGSPPSTATPPSTSSLPPARPAPPAVSVLEVKVSQRTEAVVGSNVTFNVEIANRGTTVAREVTVSDTFDPGLEPQLSNPSIKPDPSKPITSKVGDLAAGESRQFSLTFRVTKPGRLCHRVEVVAADGGRASQPSCVTAAPASEPPEPDRRPPGGATVVPAPAVPAGRQVDIQVAAQANTAAVGQNVVFVATIRNLTQQPLTNVTIRQQSDAALAVRSRSEGAAARGDEWFWTVPSLPPGETVRPKVQCECRQATPRACCRFIVTLSDGQQVPAEACIEVTAANPLRNGAETVPSPAVPSRLSIKVENRNTVWAGKNQQFLVVVSNDGDAAENDVVVTAQLPQGSSLVASDSSGPDASVRPEQLAGMVRFSPLAELPPTKAGGPPANPRVYRITVTTSRPGPITLHVEATSRRHPQPVEGNTTVEVLSE